MPNNKERYLEAVKTLVQIIQYEGNLIWQRFGHYVIIIGALLLAFTSFSGITIETRYLLCIAGILISVLWLLMTHRSWKWYEFYIDKVKEYQKKVTLDASRKLEIFPKKKGQIKGVSVRLSIYAIYILMIVMWSSLVLITYITNNFSPPT